MADWPDWIKQALNQRFDELANTSATHHDIHALRMKLSNITDEFKKQLEPEMYLKILEWEEMVNHQHSTEKEWLYHEGVRDGLLLMKEIYRITEGRNHILTEADNEKRL